MEGGGTVIGSSVQTTAGCLLGDPDAENVYIDGGNEARVISCEFMAKSPEQLDLNLLG